MLIKTFNDLTQVVLLHIIEVLFEVWPQYPFGLSLDLFNLLHLGMILLIKFISLVFAILDQDYLMNYIVFSWLSLRDGF